jgi:hypothetical protein
MWEVTVMRNALMAATIGMAAQSAASDDQLKVGDWGVVLNSVEAGCLALDDLKTYVKLRVRGYLINAMYFAFMEHRCRQFDVGTEVEVKTRVPGAMCVRPRDEKLCLWTAFEVVVSKAQYNKYKAIEEEAHARFKATEEENEKAFNKEHPECVDWQTRKDLPDYCY